MTTKRKTFSKEYKQEAVRLLEQGQRSPAEIARELGIKAQSGLNQDTHHKIDTNQAQA